MQYIQINIQEKKDHYLVTFSSNRNFKCIYRVQKIGNTYIMRFKVTTKSIKQAYKTALEIIKLVELKK